MLLVSYLKKHCLAQGHEDFSPAFFGRSFTVLAFIFNSMSHFALILWMGQGMNSSCFSFPADKYLIVPAPFAEKVILFSNELPLYICKKSAVYICVSIVRNSLFCPVGIFVCFDAALHNFRFGVCIH